MAPISFSIVIVCLNSGKKLMPTIESVLSQQYGNFEIIIKDGISIDGSLDRLPKDSRIRLYKQTDKGIYDAMNQALPYITGQYVLFLNCGDLFHDNQVLARMAEAIAEKLDKENRPSQKEKTRIFYGDQYNLKQQSVVSSAPEMDDLACFRNVPCHQVCFYDARLFSERGYDIRYRVRGDYEHFLYCIYARRAEAVHVDVLVADYEGGGFSETKENRKCSAKEHKEITKKYLGTAKTLKYRAIMALTLAPLRTRLAEDERYAAKYNEIKTAVYKRMKKK